MPTYHPDPPRLPADLHGEQDVLARLRVLPPGVHVFCRLKLLDETANRDRELDFLLLHPELGLVLIEVKGGRIAFDGQTWSRVAAGGLEPMRESPGAQLDAQQYLLLNTLKRRSPGFMPQLTRFLALPHMDLEGRDLGPDLPNLRILDKPKLARLPPALRAGVLGGLDAEAFAASERARYCRIPEARLPELVAALEPDLLPPPSLRETWAEEERLQDEAADTMLGHLAGNFAAGRFHLKGAPGSGKSLLGRRTAALWAAEGRKVLHIAYNRALVYATQTAMDQAGLTGRVDVATFHDFAVTQLHAAGLAPEAGDDLQGFFDRRLPEMLAANLDRVPDLWDALVVDEAQDLEPAWVQTLTRLLREPDQDPVLLLEDPSQGLYRQVAHNIGVPWRLDLNLRQHPAIRRAVWEALPQCGWGPPPEAPADGALHAVRSRPETWKEDLRRVLQELAEAGVGPAQALILAPHHPERSLGLRHGQLLGPWRLNTQRDWWEGEVADFVRIGTVHAFKGLEADVVVYLAPSTVKPHHPRLRYAALSRARRKAVVLEKAIPEPERAEPSAAPIKVAEATPAPRFHAATAMEGQRTALLDALRAAKRPAGRRS